MWFDRKIDCESEEPWIISDTSIWKLILIRLQPLGKCSNFSWKLRYFTWDNRKNRYIMSFRVDTTKLLIDLLKYKESSPVRNLGYCHRLVDNYFKGVKRDAEQLLRDANENGTVINRNKFYEIFLERWVQIWPLETFVSTRDSVSTNLATLWFSSFAGACDQFYSTVREQVPGQANFLLQDVDWVEEFITKNVSRLIYNHLNRIYNSIKLVDD